MLGRVKERRGERERGTYREGEEWEKKRNIKIHIYIHIYIHTHAHIYTCTHTCMHAHKNIYKAWGD